MNREDVYRRQNAGRPLTPRQCRRIRHKANRDKRQLRQIRDAFRALASMPADYPQSTRGRSAPLHKPKGSWSMTAGAAHQAAGERRRIRDMFRRRGNR